MTQDETKEVLDRLRRVETRLTSYLVKQGEVVGGTMPRWDITEACVIVAAMDCAISRCLSCVPQHVRGDIDVCTEDMTHIATLHIGG